jgi:hypothetical protein
MLVSKCRLLAVTVQSCGGLASCQLWWRNNRNSDYLYRRRLNLPPSSALNLLISPSDWPKAERKTIWRIFFFSTGFYSPYRTLALLNGLLDPRSFGRTPLAFLNGLLDPQSFGRTPWLGDQSNTRPLPKHRTTQHRNTQTQIHAPTRIRTCHLSVQAVVDGTCLRPLDYWDRPVTVLGEYIRRSKL